MLEGEAAYCGAIDDVLARASRSVRIFDGDLSSGGYSGLARYELLRAFLANHPRARLEVVLHDTRYFTTACPRLMGLLRLYSHKIAIGMTQEHARIAGDAILLVDDLHYVHRFHQRGARFLYALHDPGGAHELRQRFEQLRESSLPAVSATTLGL